MMCLPLARFFLPCLLLAGCTTTRIEPLALIQGRTEAIMFDRRNQQRKDRANVSVAGLPEILARATWVDGSIRHKGGFWLDFTGAREVFVPVGFTVFLVAGVPGHFEIRPEDAGRYLDLVQKVNNAANGLAD